jgi:uncharacterized protein (DUF697 family)
LVTLAALHKPIIVVLNKVDLYSRDQRTRLLEVLRNDRLVDIVPSEQIVTAAADPREKEYILTAADGTERSEWRRPAVDIADLRVLDKEGLSLLAINAALYASDQSDRIATLRIELRNRQANKVIWSYAVVKSLAVGLNPVPAFDVAGGTAADAALVMTLASVYGLEVTWKHAGELVWSIIMAAGWTSLSVAATSMLLSAAKLIPIKGQLLVAIPQGAAAGYGSYIVGQAAKYYFEHGSSWGNESPKQVVQRILADAERDSVLQNLKEEIRRKLTFNRHAAP